MSACDADTSCPAHLIHTGVPVATNCDCAGLTNVTIPNSVTSIGDRAFGFCTNLTAVYFAGNPPNIEEEDVFSYAFPTIYYLPGTTGWGPIFASCATAP